MMLNKPSYNQFLNTNFWYFKLLVFQIPIISNYWYLKYKFLKCYQTLPIIMVKIKICENKIISSRRINSSLSFEKIKADNR